MTNINTEVKYSSFSFTVNKKIIDFIRAYVNFKRIKENKYHYNQSDAVREGIEYMKKHYSAISARPASEAIPTRRGKAIGSGMSGDIQPAKITTSFYISEVDRNFIYDFIFHEISSGKVFSKEDFLNILVKFLETNTPTFKFNF